MVARVLDVAKASRAFEPRENEALPLMPFATTIAREHAVVTWQKNLNDILALDLALTLTP